jgi:hypothetical protein
MFLHTLVSLLNLYIVKGKTVIKSAVYAIGFEFEYSRNPENCTSDSVATGRVSLAGQVKG